MFFFREPNQANSPTQILLAHQEAEQGPGRAAHRGEQGVHPGLCRQEVQRTPQAGDRQHRSGARTKKGQLDPLLRLRLTS